MKLKDIFNWLKRAGLPEKQEREIEKEDPYATIKHKTKTLGFRHHRSHNCRKKTRGRKVQYIYHNGSSKPIYHTVIQ